MKKLLMILFSFLLIILVALIALPFFIPTSYYKKQIEKNASEALNRPVKINGKIGLSLFPPVSVTAHNIVVENTKEFSRPALIELKKMKASLKLWALLQKKVEINEFTLKSPKIYLEKNKKGEINWAFGEKTEPEKQPKDKTHAKTHAKKPFERRPDILPLKDLRLDRIHIEDGLLLYQDGMTNKNLEINQVSLSVEMPSLHQPFILNGGFQYKKNRIETALKLDSLNRFFEAKETPFSLHLKTELVKADFTGQFLQSHQPDFSGNLIINLVDLKKLAEIFKMELGNKRDVFDKFRLEGKLSGGLKGVEYSDLLVNFDKIKANGTLDIDWSQKKPFVKAHLSIPELNLTPYFQETPPISTKTLETFPSSSSSDQKTESASKEISSEQAKNTQNQTQEWSKEAMDFSALGQINALFDLDLSKIAFNDIVIDKMKIKTDLSNAKLRMLMSELNAYDGIGSGDLTLNARTSQPLFNLKADLHDFELYPFLSSVVKIDKLKGKTGVTISLKTKGNSQDLIVRNLSGEGHFTVEDGKISGINIGQIARTIEPLLKKQSIQSLTKLGKELIQSKSIYQYISPEQSTDFSKMNGSFQLVNGVVNNDDLVMSMPYLNVFGKGNLSLVQKQIAYRLTPKLTKTSTNDQTDKNNFLPFDIIIQGSLTDPKITLDIDRVEKIVERNARKEIKKEGLKLIEKNLDKNTSDFLKNIIDPKNDSSKDQKDQQKKPEKKEKIEDKAKDLLKNLFDK